MTQSTTIFNFPRKGDGARKFHTSPMACFFYTRRLRGEVRHAQSQTLLKEKIVRGDITLKSISSALYKDYRPNKIFPLHILKTRMLNINLGVENYKEGLPYKILSSMRKENWV